MKLKTILFIIVATALTYLLANYTKVEFQTNISFDDFENVPVPEEIREYRYGKIFNLNGTTAKLLFKITNGDKVFVSYFREPNMTQDPTDIREFGPWQYHSYEYVTKLDADPPLKGYTFPPYF